VTRELQNKQPNQLSTGMASAVGWRAKGFENTFKKTPVQQSGSEKLEQLEWDSPSDHAKWQYPIATVVQKQTPKPSAIFKYGSNTNFR
jgi:hypothetical protein